MQSPFNAALDAKCAYCGRKCEYNHLCASKYDGDLSDYDMYAIDYGTDIIQFCDLFCAKLYDTNIHKICIDAIKHREHYIRGELSKTAADTYAKCKQYMFTQLPLYANIDIVHCDYAQRRAFKKEYANML